MFKEGDIVELVRDFDWLVKGEIGTVRNSLPDEYTDVGVDWGRGGTGKWEGAGHYLDGHIITSTGWYVPSKYLSHAIVDLENK